MPHAYSQQPTVQIGQAMANLTINGASVQSPPQTNQKQVSKQLPPLPGQVLLDGSNGKDSINTNSYSMQGQVQAERLVLPHAPLQSPFSGEIGSSLSNNIPQPLSPPLPSLPNTNASSTITPGSSPSIVETTTQQQQQLQIASVDSSKVVEVSGLPRNQNESSSIQSPVPKVMTFEALSPAAAFSHRNSSDHLNGEARENEKAQGIPSPIQQNGPGLNSLSAASPPPGGVHSFLAATNDRPVSPSRMSISDETRAQHAQHIRRSSMGQNVGSGRVSPIPMNNTNTNSYLKPIPSNSEDWAALVDTPASPTMAYGKRPFSSNQPVFLGAQGGYTDSPTEEYTVSSDYMQHVSQQQQQYQYSQIQPSPIRHTQTDPALSLHHNGPVDQGYPIVSMPSPNNMSMPNNRMNRGSWSPNAADSLDGSSTGNSYGFHTPPRRPDGSPIPGHRSGSHSKQNSVATSVSLLSDTAVLAKYREAAIRTNDTTLQLSYAKYLLEIGEPSQTYSLAIANGELQPPPSSGSAVSPASSGPGAPPAQSGPMTAMSPMDAETPESLLGKRQLTQEAIYWIDRLAKEGQSEAQYIRGTWYEEGLYGTKKSSDKALRYYQSSSKGDFTPAHYKVASFCEKRKDNNKAVVLYKKAATHNEVSANYRLAMVYLNGELGQSKNMKTGLQYLKRAASFATEASPMSAYVLGQILAREYTQINIPDDVAFPDDGEALEWFKKAAELGYGPANYKLGTCYEYGTLGCKVDPFISIQHYEHAVMASDSNGEAEMALSGWYLSGAEDYFEADDTLAYQYALKAAEKGLAKAQYALGYYHEVGISVPIDMSIAMDYYRKAAANGNKDAQARLADKNKFDRNGLRNSMRKINEAGRSSKDQNCAIM
ncbi:hypothetical protein BGZ46_002708 [Entomortierella lignicola]|nr:hypothetical protein BGZ46_002708 [Entomortierella lignicola]